MIRMWETFRRITSLFFSVMGDAEEENVPEYFHDTKWPQPRPRRGQARGKDEALVWFMDYFKEDIEEVDVRRIHKKNRLFS